MDYSKIEMGLNMKLILLFGPQAVGKMTVGQELEKITDLKLFHNHMTIDLLDPFFGFSPEMWRLTHLFREEVFKSFSKSDQYGMIFTFIWAFNQQEDWDYVGNIRKIFAGNNAEIYFVELEADVKDRLERNRTENRLQHKPIKRNIAQSEAHLVNSMNEYRMNSNEGEIKEKNYIKINNTNLTASQVAQIIKEKFEFM